MIWSPGKSQQSELKTPRNDGLLDLLHTTYTWARLKNSGNDPSTSFSIHRYILWAKIAQIKLPCAGRNHSHEHNRSTNRGPVYVNLGWVARWCSQYPLLRRSRTSRQCRCREEMFTWFSNTSIYFYYIYTRHFSYRYCCYCTIHIAISAPQPYFLELPCNICRPIAYSQSCNCSLVVLALHFYKQFRNESRSWEGRAWVSGKLGEYRWLRRG